MTKQKPRRPEAPFRLPEGDVSTLRRIYKAGGWKRELLEEAFAYYKKTNRYAKKYDLPDTFAEMLDKEKAEKEGDASTYPDKVYIGIIGKGNLIWEDTECAKAVIARIDSGDYTKKTQTALNALNDIFLDFDIENAPKVLAEFMLEPSEEEGKTIKQRLAETSVNANFFVDPGGTLEDMIAGAKTDKAKRDAIALYKTLTELGFDEIVSDVAKKTGAKVEQVKNAKKRTDAQYKELVSEVRKKITEKMETIYKSNFLAALWEMNANYTSKSKLSSATQREAARYAAFYFFAKHPEINLRAQDTLTTEQGDEARAIFDRLLDFMEKRLKESQKKKELLGAWEAFMKFVEAENPEEDEQEAIEEAVYTTAQEVKEQLFLLDKLDSNVWHDITYSRPSLGDNMQLSMGFSFEDYRDNLPAFDTASKEAKAKGENALVIWGLRFEDLPENIKITKELTPYDRLCHDAVGTLFRAGARIVTPTQIYRAMGRESRPSKRDLEKINASLTKMRAAIIYIDNTEEKGVNKSYPLFKYDGALLPFERLKAVINGKETETAIRLLAEPPLVRFATARGQYRTIPLSVWAFPLSLTNTQIRIAQYMTEYILHTKRNKQLSRILTYETIYKNCGVLTTKQKQRARESIEKLVDYWRDDCKPAFIGKKSQAEKEKVTLDT